MKEDEGPERPRRQPDTIAERLVDRAEGLAEQRSRLIERWAKAPTWTRHEGIALAWTLEPKNNEAQGDSSLLAKRQVLPEEAQHYLDLAGRSSDLEMRSGRVKPHRFIAWAHEIGLAFHPDWHRATDPSRFGTSYSKDSVTNEDRLREELISSWAKAPYWSTEEGAALAYDLDPSEVIEPGITGYDGPTLKFPPDTMQFFRLADRAQEVGDLGAKPKPFEFVNWARSIDYEFHPAWWNAIEDAGADSGEGRTIPPTGPPPGELGTRERDSLLKLVIGMAVEQYGYDPQKLKNTAITNIQSDLARHGLSLDTDTIRKWLRAGADLLSRSIEEDE